MRRAAEIAAFLGLSAAVHAGVMAGLGDPSGGPQGQGAGGSDRVTLQAAPESLAALVEHWTEAPEPAPTPVALQAQTLPAAPRPPAAVSAAPRAALPFLPDPMLPDTTPQASGPAPALSRPALPPGPPALHMATPEPSATLQRQAEIAAPTRIAPRLITPEAPADPDVATVAPPPPRSTALATATSPRPPQRPVEPPRAASPTQRSAPPSAPQPARVAAGSGSGATQGAGATATQAPATLSAAQQQSLMAQWGGQIMARIERARPRVRASGQVVLALQVSRGGQLAGLSVARSSGDPVLDEAAMTAVRRAGTFPAAPAGLTEASYGFSLPIRFR